MFPWGYGAPDALLHTVACHLRRIFCKLDVSSRVQLARLAAEQAGQGIDAHARAAPAVMAE
jgi:hypothetical protein